MTRFKTTLLALLATFAWLTPAFADGHLATVTVIHGIDGRDLGADQDLPVDVFVEGVGCVLTDFRFGDISEPRFELPEGTYNISVKLSDGDCGGPTAIGPAPVPFAAGENATVIAHLTAEGDPTASKFVNDVSPSGPGEGRAAVHHTAAAPAVDIRLYSLFPFNGWKPALELDGVTNGQSAASDLGRGLYVVSIAPAGDKPIFYQFLHLEKAVTSFVYAVGSVAGGTFTLLLDVQEQVEEEVGDDLAEVTVIHGINGLDLGAEEDLPVDVFVEGVGCVLTDFRFGEISEPRFELPAGTYDISVKLSDGACGGATAIGPAPVPFEAGESATVIAHLTAEGDPTATKYVNDLSAARYGRSRLAIHHDAVAPAVDIKVKRYYFRRGGRVVWRLEDVTNPLSAEEDLRAGLYKISIAPAGDRPIFYERLKLGRHEAARVYAVGSVANGTFQLLVDRQQLDR